MQGLRAYGVAEADALNANNPLLPSLVAASTARRAPRHAVLFAEELGRFAPGPRPTAVLGVNVVSETKRNIIGCSLEEGYVLDKQGGSPTKAPVVESATFQMVLEGGVWKVDTVVDADGVSCVGVPLT